jgi:hypothetical protein
VEIKGVKKYGSQLEVYRGSLPGLTRYVS